MPWGTCDLKSQQVLDIQENCVSELPVLWAPESPSCGLVVLTDMNMYILTEVRNLKTFLKENYAITGQSLPICEKKC